MDRQTSQILETDQLVVPDPLVTANSGRLLAVSEHKRSGLILCGEHYAEFAGPGAAVGTLIDQQCKAVIAIGAPEIIEMETADDRQRAYGHRIQWLRWLQKITDHTDPIQRAEKLFAGLEAFFGKEVLGGLPDDVLALLAGVLPQTIGVARSNYRNLGQSQNLSNGPSIISLHPQILHVPLGYSISTMRSAGYVKQVFQRPCSA